MEWLTINPALTLKELTDMLEGSFGVEVCYQTLLIILMECILLSREVIMNQSS